MEKMSGIFSNDITLMLPEIFLGLGALLVLGLGVAFDKYIISLGVSVGEVVTKLSSIVMLGTGGLFWNLRGVDVNIFSQQIKKNELSLWLGLLVIVGGLVCLYFMIEYYRWDTISGFEFPILLLLATSGMLVLVTANDLLVVYLGLELQSLALYVLATFKPESNFSTEAGLKYFVLGAVSSCMFLFGISFIYIFTGMTNLEDLRYFFSVGEVGGEIPTGVIVGGLCILVGLLFKVGAVPFHMWLPDVYEGAPTVVTAIFGIMPKIAIFGLIGKIYFNVFGLVVTEWNILFVYAGVLSLLVGSLGALYQERIKRLIAYSAIGHTGYIILGLVAGSVAGLESVYLYLLIYMILVINMFAIIVSVRKYSDFKLQKLMGNFYRVYGGNKALGVSLGLLLFSIGGVPPLAGFFSKLYVFFAVIKEGYYLLSIVAVLLSVIGIVYYLRLLKIMLFTGERGWSFYLPVGDGVAYIIAYSTIFGCLFCVGGESVVRYIEDLVLLAFM